MNKTCPICGKQFETHDKRKKYCSIECARRARSSQNYTWNKNDRDAKRMEWAKNEARDILRMASTLTVDQLAYYIYNNYEKKRKRRSK